MTCQASGVPKLIVYWVKEDTDQRIYGSLLNFTSINRNDSGTYRCEAENDCGNDSRIEIINVSCKYENTHDPTEYYNSPPKKRFKSLHKIKIHCTLVIKKMTEDKLCTQEIGIKM